MIERGISCTNIEYVEICKTIRKLLRDDFREYKTVSQGSSGDRKGLKKATTKE